MIRIGLAGLPNAGKSTLFNLLTGAHSLIAPYPFSTVTPNKAHLKLYDKDGEALAEAIKAPDILRTEVEVWDIAGLIENASLGEGLGNEFLGQIKDCDVVVHVVRVNQTSTRKSVLGELATVLTEIALFDHKCLLQPFEKGRRMARLYPNNVVHKAMDKTLSKAYYGTKEGAAISDVLDEEGLATIHDIGLISAKPRITLCNIDTSAAAKNTAKAVHGDVVSNLLELSALVSMSEADRQFLGYSNEPIYTLLQEFCDLLIRKTRSKRFYTVGHLGVGEWVVPAEADAKTCAQLVHDNLSETIKTIKVAKRADFMRLKNWASLTKHGLVKKYGPAYVPHDKDILYFEAG